MDWQSVFLRDERDIATVHRAVVDLLDLAPETLCVVASTLELPYGSHHLPPDFVLVWHKGGDFHQMLELSLREPPQGADADTFFVRLAARLGTDLLVEDGGSSNPYDMRLVTSSGAIEMVAIDPQAGDRDEIIVQPRWAE